MLRECGIFLVSELIFVKLQIICLTVHTLAGPRRAMHLFTAHADNRNDTHKNKITSCQIMVCE